MLEQNVKRANCGHDIARLRRLCRPAICSGTKDWRDMEKLTAHAA